MVKKLSDIFSIKTNDIISITGSGGKTSLMFNLARDLSEFGKVLVTTSTKIRLPKKGFDILYVDEKFYEKPNSNVVVVLGNLIKEQNKLKSIQYKKLQEIVKDFDYVLIEADGSRNLPLKARKDHEPLIYNLTTKAICVFSIRSFGKIPKEDFIYNYEGFIKNYGSTTVDERTFVKIFKDEKTIFKDFDGDKYIYINQVEDSADFKNVEKIKGFYKKPSSKLVYGSIKKGLFYEN